MVKPPIGSDGGDPSAAATVQDIGQITRSTILQSALRIIERDSMDGLSMRHLSDDPDWAAQLRSVAHDVRRLASGRPGCCAHWRTLVRALAPALAAYDGAAELDRGLDLLLLGLTATLTDPDGAPRSG